MEQIPDRGEIGGQGGETPEVTDAFSRAVKIGAARGIEAELQGKFGIFARLRCGMAARDHLDCLTAQRLEAFKQGPLFGFGEAVATRMRDYGDSPGGANPAQGLVEAGPFVFDIARLARCEIAAEHLVGLAAHAEFHQQAGKVRA